MLLCLKILVMLGLKDVKRSAFSGHVVTTRPSTPQPLGKIYTKVTPRRPAEVWGDTAAGGQLTTFNAGVDHVSSP